MLFYIFIAILLLFVFGYLALWKYSKSIITPYTLDSYHFDDVSKADDNYSIFDEPTLKISIVFPAYFEQRRIGKNLENTLAHLEKKQKQDPNYTFEIIIVDDGTPENVDKTAAIVRDFIKKNDKGRNIIRLLRLIKNRGKGFAVKQGVLRARGETILFADSDGATEFTCLDKMEDELKKIVRNKHGIAIGSRKHLEADAKRSFFRGLVGWASHFLIRYIAGIYCAKDTQCGFKLFTRESAKILFMNLNSDRWCFDVDLLHMAQVLDIPVKEVPVKWEDKEGSKLTLWGMATMARDLLLVRLYYAFGFWKIEEPKKEKLVGKEHKD